MERLIPDYSRDGPFFMPSKIRADLFSFVLKKKGTQKKRMVRIYTDSLTNQQRACKWKFCFPYSPNRNTVLRHTLKDQWCCHGYGTTLYPTHR